MDCDYNTDVYDEATVQRWLGYYETLLAGIAHNRKRRSRHCLC